MGYSQEIITYQNPYAKISQLFELYNYLLDEGWTLSTREDNLNIQYSIKSGDWLELPMENKSEFENILRNQAKENLWTSFQLKHSELDRIVWLTQYENVYNFELQISSNDEYEIQWFERFQELLSRSLTKLKHIIYSEWRTGYDDETIRIQTDIYHEGVLILCSSNRLKQFYNENAFNYDYPHGLNELFEQKIIIAIDSKDYVYTTILEKVKISEWKYGYYNSIDFTEKDELLILHHGDFTMICDKHNGDYKSYGWKNLIVIPIKQAKDQVMLIAKPNDLQDKRLIIQFTDIERRQNKNFWIEYVGIPTNNKWP